ncbi:MAG: TIGR03118 family protein [Betaproteobacteria bacterium]|nr:MAG: TIGR03118 family protein [Betaproteobacteria bacterium]
MSRIRSLLLAGTAFAVAAAATSPTLAQQNRYEAKVLVSDGFVPNTPVDPHLVNGWGVALSATSPMWVSDNGTGLSTIYTVNSSGVGVPGGLVVTIPPAPGNTQGKPTGIVFNTTSVTATPDFLIPPSGALSRFIFATEDGLIAAWSGGTTAVQVYPPNGGTPVVGTVYKGLALAHNGTANFLYAADFVGGKIDVFDKNFAPVTSPGGFVDPDLQKNFSPFNVQNIKGNLFVTYAKLGEDAPDETAGPSLGIVNEFNADGVLLRRFATRGRLNAPWGVALAPASFGKFGGALLIGNFGDGTINAFDLQTAEFLGQLKGLNNRSLKLDGLWGMAFGNDHNNLSSGTLYFAAGPNDEDNGVFGSVTPAPNEKGDAKADGD